MQQTCYQIPNPSAATALLEKILSRKCKFHPQFPCEYIHVKPTEFSPRLCCQCVEDQNILSSDYVSIRYLLQASSNTTFKAYPKLTDSQITQKLQEFKGSDDKVSEDLLSFFDNLQSRVSTAIEKQKSVQKSKLSSLQNRYQGIYDSLAQISQIEKFKQLVNNNNDNENMLKRFIDDQYSNANNYTQTINCKLSEYQKIYSAFSLTDPKNKLEQIIKLIEGIEFFPIILQSQANKNYQEQSVVQQQYPLFQQQTQQQLSLSSSPIQQQQQQQIGQQQKEKQQQQSLSSLEVYNYYESLIKHGEDRKILKWEQQYGSYGQSYGESKMWKQGQYGSKWSYADTYEIWTKFSEVLRQQQLNLLKELLGINN